MGFQLAPPAAAPTRLLVFDALRGWFITSLVGVLAWIICETVGGLLFLAMGVRLWAYHITPIFWAIASYTGWLFVFVVLGAGCTAYLLWEHHAGVTGRRRWLYRSVFLVCSGPVAEVLWNTVIWTTTGTPLYLYTVAPTFGGSGSLLSPLYYQTLLLGFWLEELIPGTLAHAAARRRGRSFKRTHLGK